MLIVFDADGVLLHASWKALRKGHEAIIADLGKNPRRFFKNPEEFKKWWNPDWRVTYECIGVKDEKRANEVFYQVYGHSVYTFYWVEEIVKKLLEKHLLAILTSGDRGNIDRHFRFLKNNFFLIISMEDVKKLKPDPEGLNIILAEAGYKKKKEKVLFIGDTLEDVITGKAAKVKTGVVKWGLGDWEKLLALKPDYLFEKPEDLLRI